MSSATTQAPQWDADQEAVISAPRGARLLVDAGPGTGKTAVACARVARLIDDGADPGHIWLISFTRTAVAELRDRIRSLAEDEIRAAAVRIATLDSHSWYLREGFDPGDAERLFIGYEEGIEAAIDLLRGESEEIEEYFGSVQHLIVDEAQDLVGQRAELLEAMLELIDEQCGVTIFTDDAQAIYGFSEEQRASEEDRVSGTFPVRVRESPHHRFHTHRLRSVHRTSSESLRQIFTETREVVLGKDGEPNERLERVISGVQKSADGSVGKIEQQGLAGRDDILVLFRRRAEVLMASSFLRREGISHRIRMSGVPQILEPWLAVLFHDSVDPFVTEQDFDRRWEERISSEVGGPRKEEAWELLDRAAGERFRGIGMRRLRSLLSRARPPVAFVRPELGRSGPILGTIHASKGREAPYVHLMLPTLNPRPDDDLDEESRVVFVGATRSREALRVGQGYRFYASSLENSRRVYRFGRGRQLKAQVEVGLEGDLDRCSPASSRLFEDAGDVQAVQRWLRDNIGRERSLKLVPDPDEDFRYEIRPEDEEEVTVLGFFNNGFNSDLFEVGKHLARGRQRRRLRPSSKLRYCYLTGVATHVLQEDDPRLSELLPPWDESGFLLVPVVSGFTNVYYRGY